MSLLLLLVGPALNPLESQIIAAVSDQGLQGALRASFSTVTGSLLTGISIIAALGVLAALVLFAMGDTRSTRPPARRWGRRPASPRATAGRSWSAVPWRR